MSGTTIVLAEDDQNLRQLYSDFLNAHGYVVMSASDGLESLSLLHRVQPRILLLDIVMPGLNGIETCRRARQIIDQNTPILFLTSLDFADHVKQGLEAGGDDYILKTSSLDTILERVQYWTSRTARGKSERRRSKALDEIRKIVEDQAMETGSGNLQWRADPRATALNEFVTKALSVAGVNFGSTRQQRVYFLGYVAGAIDFELGQNGQLDEQFLKYFRGALRSSGIFDQGQIEKMLNAFNTLAVDELVKWGWRKGRRDMGAASTGGHSFTPHGLADFKAVA